MQKNGFTLVELAIVMIIIGLMVGGILKAQSMIENARINGLIKQVNEISSAIDTFQQAYRQKPGDAASATVRVRGCTPPNCINGDGNNLIGSDGVDRLAWNSNLFNFPFSGETVQFWKHLAIADMIAGIDQIADPNAPAFGTTHLASPFGGGYEIFYDPRMHVGAGNQVTSMHVLRLNGRITGGSFGLVNAVIAQAIDTIMDDGDPNGGLVFADYGNSDGECKNPGATARSSVYDVAREDATCVLFFRMFNR